MKEQEKNKSQGGGRLVYYFELLILLLILWFVMSEIFEPKFIIFGVSSCVIIALICIRVMMMDGLKSDRTYFVLHVNPIKFLAYFLWLVKEIVKAAWYVSKLCLAKHENINPQIVWFKADYDNPIAAVLLANSITLTPGTITVDIYKDGIFSVHALNDELAEGVLTGDMQQRVAKVYGETIDFQVVDPVEIVDNTIRPDHRLKKKIYTRKETHNG